MSADQEPWGQVGVVLLTRYDHLDRLKRLESEVRSALDLLATMGFQIADHDILTADGKAASLQAAIGNWRPPARRLVVYWAGHGKAIEGGRLFLCSRETAKHRQPESYDAVPAGNLGDLLAGKDAQELVLILDACGAGGGAEEIVAAFRAKTESRAYASGFKPGLAVISSAGRKQFAREGAFSQALVSVLRDGPPADPSYLPWTERDEYLTPVELFQAVRVQLRRTATRGGVQIPDHDATSGVGRFFPNPRYRALVPDIGVAEKQRRGALLPSAVAEHFMLKFRGIDTVDDQGWFFTGRERLLRRLVGWLTDDRPGMVVVTGAPGSGKSALLGRLAVLSVPQYRNQVERAGGLVGVPAATVPPPDSLDAGVHAKNLTLAECVAELADALRLPAPSAGWRSAADFVRQVASLRRPVTLLVDALDEAQPADVSTIAADLLRPLAELPAVKVLVGTRPDRATREGSTGSPAPGTLLHALGAHPPDTIWLDHDNDARGDIEAYVSRRLMETPGSPYAGQPGPAATAAQVVARRSDRVFLIARLLTRELVQRDRPLDLDDLPDPSADWLLIEGGLGAAFAADLARYGRDERRLRDLLAPLAFAEGAGLPSREVWLALAEALRPAAATSPAAVDAPQPAVGASAFTEADLGWVVANAGAYLIESGEDGQTVYRLYHQAFADYFRRGGRPLREAHERITDALLSLVPRDGGRQWHLANPYLLRHLASHAAEARRLGELTEDSRYLLYAEPQRLQRALAIAGYRTHPLVRLYLRCVDGFVGTDARVRAAVMQGVALRDEPEALPLLHTEPELPWRGLWSVGQRAAFHRRLPSHASPVTAVAFGDVRRTLLLATAAGDGVVRLWNPATGEQWGRFSSHGGTVFALVFDRSGLRRLLVTGTQDGTVGCWDPADGRLIRSIAAHDGPVFTVAIAETANGALLATAGEDGVIRLWDPDTGRPRAALHGHHAPVRTLTFGAEAGRPILVSGGDDGRARIWHLGSLRQIREFRGMGWIYAAALGHVAERSVLATASAFGTVRLWDLTTGDHLASFAGHAGPVNALAFGTVHGRTLLATGGDDGAIRLWDPHNGSPAMTLTRSTPLHVTDLTAKPERWVPAIGATISRAADPDPGPEVVLSGRGRSRSVQALAWGTVAGAAILASGDGDWLARLWDTTVGGIAEPHRQVGLVLCLAGGSVHGYPMIAAGGADGRVRLWDARTGRQLRVLDGHDRAVRTVALAAVAGRPIAASGGEDGTVVLWDAVTGDQIHRLDLRGPSARAAYAEAVVVGEVSGRTVVLTAAGYGGIAMWDALSGKQIQAVGGSGNCGTLALGAVGSRPTLISAGASPEVFATDLESERTSALTGHTDTIRAVAFGYVDGQPVAVSGGADQTVRLWDLATGKQLRVLEGHGGGVSAVAIGLAGRQPVVVSGGGDHTVRLWDARTGDPLGLLADHAEPVTAATFVEVDGVPLVCTGGQDGIHLMQISRVDRVTRGPGG
ncbi:MAG TPA: WD40 repeat domain-containing protein [Pilimelia sp.]|nr:WD40 repeat domain-containing protein [Pilimelia sp.]